MIPTFNEAIYCYKNFCKVERLKNSSPSEATSRNTIKGVKQLCRAAKINLDSNITAFTRDKFDEAIINLTSRGVKGISIKSFVSQFRALFAKWTSPYYKNAGWQIPAFEYPEFRFKFERYRRPGEEKLAKGKEWYFGREGELWLMATMMLEFAMRNGDVLRLSEDNFIEKGGRIYLCYTPHKTELTSSRHVLWPVHPEIWNKIEEYGGIRCFDISQEYFVEMNRQLREIGFNGSKASYELRKICIDHIYQKFGAEMATSISGDDIKTITRYYADPSQPNIGEVRVVDLF